MKIWLIQKNGKRIDYATDAEEAIDISNQRGGDKPLKIKTPSTRKEMVAWLRAIMKGSPSCSENSENSDTSNQPATTG